MLRVKTTGVASIGTDKLCTLRGIRLHWWVMTILLTIQDTGCVHTFISPSGHSTT